MDARKSEALKPSKEQIIYANLLLIGVVAGIIVLVATYTVYVGGFLTPHVDLQAMSGLWGKNVNEFLEITHAPQGWGWFHLLGKGDYLNYLGLVLLSLMTVVCYLVLLRGYYRQRNWIFTVISFLEIVVLSLAASGLLGGGGH